MMAFVVKCPEYTTHPIKTREAAERLLSQITEAGNCHEEHAVEEVTVPVRSR